MAQHGTGSHSHPAGDENNANTYWPSEHHVMPVKTYFNVFFALIALTITTVISGRGIHFQPHVLNIIVAMVIALVKAVLVILFFMHQKFETRMNRLIFIAGFFALILFIGLTSSDLVTRKNFVQNPTVFTDLKTDEEKHGLHPEGDVPVPGANEEAKAAGPSGNVNADAQKDEPRDVGTPSPKDKGSQTALPEGESQKK